MTQKILTPIEHVFIDALESYKHFYYAKVANLNTRLNEKIKPKDLKQRMGGQAGSFLEKVSYETTIA